MFRVVIVHSDEGTTNSGDIHPFAITITLFEANYVF